MAEQIDVQLGTTGRAPVTTRLSEGGPLINPTTGPTIISAHLDGVWNDGLRTGSSVVQLQDGTPANIAGRFELQAPTTGLAVNNMILFVIQAEVNGTTIETEKLFRVVDNAGQTPVIE